MGSLLGALGRLTSRTWSWSRATTPETTCLPTCSNMRLEIPAGGEVEEEVKPRVPSLDCGEDEILTHLLNIYDDQQDDEERVEDADSDDDSEVGPESDEDDDRIEDFIEEEDSAQARDETKECPD